MKYTSFWKTLYCLPGCIVATSRGDWLGYFAVHTAVAAVLEASITAGPKVRAIVSHCGRPDLAAPRLALVKPATLLITGSENVYLTELNWQAYELLQCEKQLVTIEGDPDQFEEVRKARRIAHLAADWFDRHFPIAPAGYHHSKSIIFC